MKNRWGRAFFFPFLFRHLTDARNFFFKSKQYLFLKKVALVRLFLQLSILSCPKIDKESICTSNSLDFTTEIKNTLIGSITFKKSEKSDNIGPEVEMGCEKNKHYPQWTTTSKRVKYGTSGPLQILQRFELKIHCLFHFIFRKQLKGICWDFQPDAAVSENLFNFFLWPYIYVDLLSFTSIYIILNQ